MSSDFSPLFDFSWSSRLDGVAMACDEEARLNIIGRFGVPRPDPLAFCEKETTEQRSQTPLRPTREPADQSPSSDIPRSRTRAS